MNLLDCSAKYQLIFQLFLKQLELFIQLPLEFVISNVRCPKYFYCRHFVLHIPINKSQWVNGQPYICLFQSNKSLMEISQNNIGIEKRCSIFLKNKIISSVWRRTKLRHVKVGDSMYIVFAKKEWVNNTISSRHMPNIEF